MAVVTKKRSCLREEKEVCGVIDFSPSCRLEGALRKHHMAELGSDHEAQFRVPGPDELIVNGKTPSHDSSSRRLVVRRPPHHAAKGRVAAAAHQNSGWRAPGGAQPAPPQPARWEREALSLAVPLQQQQKLQGESCTARAGCLISTYF
ncbi:Hypothetical protein SMAX5B_020979 [Scophthalmus maximus]|uniref:Uncharacterized protein n=1 Tax=Scophthalmus maximus TaxID=52904 RepID=A0A2U9CQZ1_SCOMX|nr:Hypothetical protein SMAX5B_020979 [Scophthalmus maximus]